MNYDFSYQQYGWICPLCGKVNSPSSLGCNWCDGHQNTSGNIGDTDPDECSHGFVVNDICYHCGKCLYDIRSSAGINQY